MLVSPSSPIPIPSDIAKARTEALNSVTQAEAEYRRLVEMQVAKEMEIVELVKRKIYEEEQFEKVSKDLVSITESVAKAIVEEAHLMAEIDQHRKEALEVNNLLKERELRVKKAELSLEERSEILLEKEEDYLLKYTELCQGKEAHEKRVSILEKALAQLC